MLRICPPVAVSSLAQLFFVELGLAKRSVFR
jgi:hypothetical protein